MGVVEQKKINEVKKECLVSLGVVLRKKDVVGRKSISKNIDQ